MQWNPGQLNPRISAFGLYPGYGTGNGSWLLRLPVKAVIFALMHFSRHISQLHSTFSLLAALLLRFAR